MANFNIDPYQEEMMNPLKLKPAPIPLIKETIEKARTGMNQKPQHSIKQEKADQNGDKKPDFIFRYD